MITTPVLLICFNRPDHTHQVLQRILEAQPQDLYVFQDGAREGNENDAIKCAEVRHVIDELVASHLSPLTFHHFYSDKNLGCGAGPMTGISWFFENVEQGIVMEDDCLAHPDFFPYCEELLNRYKGTEVKFINATLYHGRWHCDASYGFSHYMVTGAWASWREVWQGFDLDLMTLDTWRFANSVYQLTGDLAEAEYWWYVSHAVQKDKSKKSYWDYQMQIHLFRQGALTIHPAVNLISNIGFDAEGTHTKSDDGRGDKASYGILPLVHPQIISVLDNRLDVNCFGKKQSQGLIKDLLMCLVHIYTWRNKKWV